jgi:aspartate aminotransferase
MPVPFFLFQFINILKEELILAVPGPGFGTPVYFRLSYAVPESIITGSFEGFRRAFKKAMPQRE